MLRQKYNIFKNPQRLNSRRGSVPLRIPGRKSLPMYVVIFIVTSFSQFIPPIWRDSISGTVTHVSDGDTFKIGKTNIRLESIDAPELKQTCSNGETTKIPCGQTSKKALSDLILGKEIKCYTTQPNDAYTRFVAMCFLKLADHEQNIRKNRKNETQYLTNKVQNQQNINSYMVSNGHATAYETFSPRYVLNEKYAQIKKLGIWQYHFQEPRDYRRAHK